MGDVSLNNLYSILKILACLEKDDSLSDIQRKTGLSFTTVQKTMHDLEYSGFVTTEMGKSKRGKVRKCIEVSIPHKRVAISFLETTDKVGRFLTEKIVEKEVKSNPLLFEIAIYEKALHEIKKKLQKQVSNEMGRLFEEWIKSSKGAVSELSSIIPGEVITQCIKDPSKIVVKHKDDTVYFYPQKFSINIGISPVIKKEKQKFTLDEYIPSLSMNTKRSKSKLEESLGNI